jgi:YD repeat-containing protein
MAKHDDDHPDLPTEKEINIDYAVYDVCSSYYHFAKDTLRPVVGRVVGKDERGRAIEDIYRSYESYTPATSLSVFDSAGNMTIRYYRIDDDSPYPSLSKTHYFYNEKNLLIRSVTFDYERRLKKEADKGYGRPGGCIITEDDYEKHKSWAVSTIWNFKYDETGKLIEMIAPVINSSQNRYLYTYDAKGRLAEERSMDGNALIWVEHYNYTKGGYEFTRTWFDRDGSRRKEWNDSLQSVDTFRFKTDRFNNITEEGVIEEGGRYVSKDLKYYDSGNRIIRHEIYDDSSRLLGFYKYYYYTNKRPTKRNFFVPAN